MIKVENIEVWGFKHAVRGMRNPMNSWRKSDSIFDEEYGKTVTEIGEADLDLMKRLFKGGTEHRKYLRQIFVSMDITAPLYWWSEYDTYKVGTVANSCSKMHKLLAKPFEMNDFSFDQLPGYKNEIKQFVPILSEEEIGHEEWKAVSYGYDVSNLGRCRHWIGDTYRLLSGSKHKDGYIFVTIEGKQIPLHRLVARMFCLGYNENLVVNHKDGNKQNNKASNLEWVTQSENVIHSVKNHLQPKKTGTYQGKFSEEEREKIKAEWDEGKLSKRQLSEKYNVSHTCICDIINDKYKYASRENIFEEFARPVVDALNELRDSYFITESEEEKKQIWYEIIEILPESYNQRRTVSMNYENVFTIIHQRTGHKLSEWREFVEILKDLPYVREIGELE